MAKKTQKTPTTPKKKTESAELGDKTLEEVLGGVGEVTIRGPKARVTSWIRLERRLP